MTSSDPAFTPENTATIERLLAARNKAMSASQAVRDARGDVATAAKDLARQAIAAAEKRAATASSPTPKATATATELLALPDAKAKLLNASACYGNAHDLAAVTSAFKSITDPRQRIAFARKFKGALTKAGIR